MDSHGFATWITAQEGSIGFGWMSCPAEEERKAWMADPHCYTGGRWRYVILKPGQSVFFGLGTIHFVFRMTNPAITNEDMEWSAPKLVHVVAKLVAAKLEESGAEELVLRVC
ncbi:hypothetical protein QBC46DRAFT_368195 [Diplogelasinospora grovesii]|uniref:Uncharacterized protein n=1 Tax=Diplogelasinospora grovesii TaxID=303347 RepID=A0AAN6RYE5_9PEZI|nr:hypothetical protein QBC46DRAFT_368195 [Diplogelasinospora grovesii]